MRIKLELENIGAISARHKRVFRFNESECPKIIDLCNLISDPHCNGCPSEKISLYMDGYLISHEEDISGTLKEDDTIVARFANSSLKAPPAKKDKTKSATNKDKKKPKKKVASVNDKMFQQEIGKFRNTIRGSLIKHYSQTEDGNIFTMAVKDIRNLLSTRVPDLDCHKSYILEKVAETCSQWKKMTIGNPNNKLFNKIECDMIETEHMIRVRPLKENRGKILNAFNKMASRMTDSLGSKNQLIDRLDNIMKIDTSTEAVSASQVIWHCFDEWKNTVDYRPDINKIHSEIDYQRSMVLRVLETAREELTDEEREAITTGVFPQKMMEDSNGLENETINQKDEEVAGDHQENKEDSSSKNDTRKRKLDNGNEGEYEISNFEGKVSKISPFDGKWTDPSFITKKINEFHEKNTKKPEDFLETKEYIEDLIGGLKEDLEAKELCDCIYYAGNIYEDVSIRGEQSKIHILFVKDEKELTLEILGDSTNIRPSMESAYRFGKVVDDSGCISTIKYRQKFFGTVEKYLIKRNISTECLVLTNHGSSNQLDVFYDCNYKELWFQINLIPAIQIGDEIFRTKPSSNSTEWCQSYFIQEKELLEKLDGPNECRKHCFRIIKALFNLDSNNEFKHFTPYCIRTIAYQLKDDTSVDWNIDNISNCIFHVLCKISKHLELKELTHIFQPGTNLLKPNECQEIYDNLAKRLETEEELFKWFSD